MLLLDLLVSEGKLNELEAREIETGLSAGNYKSVDDALTTKKIADQDVADARSLLYGLPLYAGEITKSDQLLKFLTLEQTRQFKAVPLSFQDQMLSVGIVDPDYSNALSALQFIFSEKLTAYKLFIITSSQYDSYLKITGAAKSALAEVKPNVEIKKKEEKKEGEEEQPVDSIINLTDYDGNLSDPKILTLPVSEILNQVLKYALTNNASDIHIEHTGPIVRVRCRIDGSLETVLSMSPPFHSILIARIKILSLIKLDEKRKPQDGRFSTMLNDYKVDYRVSTFPSYYGEKVVMRILDSHKGVRQLNTVGLYKRHWDQVQEAIDKPYGIVLISGPTGSGKTTTLYSMLNEIDKEHENVVSLEDPIEYNMGGINQSQVFPEIGYTFATGLRSILRQDPDVILVGEIRDAETAGLAIQAALTGHMVFSTIHTNTAIGVITRLIDMGIEPYLIAPTLNAALGQRLVRGIAPNCAKPMEMTESEVKMINAQFKDLPQQYRDELPLDKPFSIAQGNEEFPSGLKGRVPVFEVLTVSQELEEAILRSAREDELTKIARKDGMITLREDAMVKSMLGRVPFGEINTL